MQLQADYLAAYRSLKLTRDASGVLVVEFHSTVGHRETMACSSSSQKASTHSCRRRPWPGWPESARSRKTS
jgi:hypothetical protein